MKLQALHLLPCSPVRRAGLNAVRSTDTCKKDQPNETDQTSGAKLHGGKI
jgi:hypothetical protein